MVWNKVNASVRVSINCVSTIKTLFSSQNWQELFEVASTVRNGMDRSRNGTLRRVETLHNAQKRSPFQEWISILFSLYQLVLPAYNRFD